MNILELRALKEQGRKLTMVTCYDFWSAAVLAKTDIDMLLVGDSASMVMHGHADTLPATVEMMEFHVAAARRGAPQKFLIADLPFLSFRSDLASNMQVVKRLFQAGGQAVKLEGFAGNGELVRHLVQSGVPVMGHLGLTPQFVHAFGGFRVQGRDDHSARLISEHARALEEAGCFALVLECVPAALAGEITSMLKIPTIGIGAGPACDGQVLVLHDLVGLNQGFKPKFLRQYLNGAELIGEAVEKYCEDVRAGKFPSSEESYDNH